MSLADILLTLGLTKAALSNIPFLTAMSVLGTIVSFTSAAFMARSISSNKLEVSTLPSEKPILRKIRRGDSTKILSRWASCPILPAHYTSNIRSSSKLTELMEETHSAVITLFPQLSMGIRNSIELYNLPLRSNKNNPSVVSSLRPSFTSSMFRRILSCFRVIIGIPCMVDSFLWSSTGAWIGGGLLMLLGLLMGVMVAMIYYRDSMGIRRGESHSNWWTPLYRYSLFTVLAMVLVGVFYLMMRLFMMGTYNLASSCYRKLFRRGN